MAAAYAGVIEADICEVRFAFSGKVASVGKHNGDTVKQWEQIASLDTKVLQTELDVELADYERARAEFEIFNLKNAQDSDDVTKFLRAQKQAALNASVKQVELAKYRLDQATLISPVAGTIVDVEGLVAGVNITPASAPVKILNASTFRFGFTISQKDLARFLKPEKVHITLQNVGKEYTGHTVVPAVGKDGQFACTAIIDDAEGLVVGMQGKATVIEGDR